MSNLDHERGAPGIPTFLVIGASGAGKTTLIERVVARMASLGCSPGTVKHASRGFDVDRPGKDSARLRAAGAVATLLVGPEEQVLFRRRGPDPLHDLVERALEGCDLVLAEGFSWEPGAKILVRRQTVPDRDPLASADDDVVLIVTDAPTGDDREIHSRDIDRVVDALVELAGLNARVER